jgi:hypothetical protein
VTVAAGKRQVMLKVRPPSTQIPAQDEDLSAGPVRGAETRAFEYDAVELCERVTVASALQKKTASVVGGFNEPAIRGGTQNGFELRKRLVGLLLEPVHHATIEPRWAKIEGSRPVQITQGFGIPLHQGQR